MKNFRTYNLAVEFYRLAAPLKLPRHLREQLSRASSSIVLNLAEARGKESIKDQKKFFYIALGSLRESQAILTLSNLEDSKAYSVLDSLGGHLYKLIQSIG